MSALACVGYFLVLTPLGLFMCAVSAPMLRETAGLAHRALGGVVCLTGGVLAGGGVWFLAMALHQVPA